MPTARGWPRARVTDARTDVHEVGSTARPAHVVAVFVLVLAPLAVVLLALVVSGRAGDWHPASDVAVEVLRIDEVGGRHTPLVGVHSRYGWDHPGPALFWALAPFTWLFGTAGVLVGVVVLNALAVTGALALARRGGTPLVVLVGIVVLCLLHALGPDLLADPWNPWVSVLPFLAFVLLVWSLADGEVPMLPWLVALGTVLVQIHVGYLPFVVGLGVVGGAMAWWAVSRARDATSSTARATVLRSAGIAAVVGAVLWLPPVLQQLFGEQGNLAAIVRYFRQPSEPPVGWRIGWGVMGTELGFPGAWLAGGELDAFGVRTSSTLPALILLAATGALGLLAWPRGASSAGRLAVLALAAAGFGVVAGSRVTGLVAGYLVRWWWVIAAVTWLSVLWSAWWLLAGTRVRAVVAVGSVAALVGLSVFMIGRAVSVEVPSARDSVAVGRLASAVMAELGDDGLSYVVDWTDTRDWGAVGSGVFVELDQRGLPVAAAARHAATFGTRRTAAPTARDGLIVVMVADEPARGVAPPPNSVAIADYDPLSPAERARTQELLVQIGERLGEPMWDWSLVDTPLGREALVDRGGPAELVDELADLRALGAGYTVFLQPHT